MAEFSVDLGNGLYMDSSGVLSKGPIPGKPIYATPGGGFPVKLDTFEKAFNGLAKALPDKNDPKSRDKFDDILIAIEMAAEDKEHLIDALQAVGAVASVVGSVIPVLGAALAVLTLLLGLFKEGPSALELLITKRFDDLARQLKSLEIQIQQRDLRDQRIKISAAMDALANYVFELKNTPPEAAVLVLRQQEMRSQLKDAGDAVRILLDSGTWLASFSQNEYSAVWPWLQSKLHTFPRDGAPLPALMPAQGANRFNHALMVPLGLFAVTSYLTVLRGLAPEFRSTRENREDLWAFARDLQTLAENMRAEGLARTVYTASDFQDGAGHEFPFGIAAEEVIDLSAVGVRPFLKPNSTRFAVGAMDLCVYNDSYFTPGFSAGSIQFAGDQYAKQGLLNVRWGPPAILESYQISQPAGATGFTTQTLYRITNPEDCAIAANAQAELDYANLLYSSGYLNLVHLIAVLRNEATDPTTSQTVSANAWLRRKPGTALPVTVHSEPILLTGVVSSPAEQEPQHYKAIVELTTQPLGRDRTLHYKVWLRTLAIGFSGGGSRWSEQDYGTFYQTDYINDADHPGCVTLVTSAGQPIGQFQIADGPSPAQPHNVSGKAVLQAITHDWWVPVKPSSVIKFKGKDSAALRALGWEAGGSTSTPNPPSTFTLLRDHIPESAQIAIDEFASWIDAVEPATGQHRMAAQNEIHIDYTLEWAGDRMTVSLHNDPTDRNYVVYLVVEETLGSGQVLHTAQRIPVIGQLTFVPQTYFDEEAAALNRLGKTMSDFASRYVRSVSQVRGSSGPPGPDPLFGLTHEQIAADPVLREYQLGGLTTRESQERLAIQAAQHLPAAAVLRQSLKEAGIPAFSVHALHNLSK
jgi:hypothetical protein